MNKIGMVLGVAAIATLAGCKDPDYNYGNKPTSQNEVKNAGPATELTPPPAPKCMCAPGTKHTAPCTCGAPDCRCVVEAKPVITADLSKPAATAGGSSAKPAATAVDQEYTIYVVQSGDYLSKISKRFNVTIASIKRLNPSIKGDVIRVGQKLKLPGKVDVPAAATPAAAAATHVASKKTYTSYTGATKEYVVKSGDTLGVIAYGNGINIRQLKELNGLTKDTLRVGQKLKIPAEKVVKTAKATKAPAAKKATAAKTASASASASAATEAVATAAAAPAAPAEAPAATDAAPAAAAEAAEAAPAEAAASAAPAAAAPAVPAAPATSTYVVQEGDDMTGVSIRWGVSAAEIRELNNLGENDQLVPGQIIKLPAEAQQ